MSNMMKIYIAIFIVLSIMMLTSCNSDTESISDNKKNMIENKAIHEPASYDHEPQIVVDDLNIPWEFWVLDDESILITQRDGKLIRYEDNISTIIHEVSDVKERGEGGLLGMTPHPDYDNNHWIYLYLTTETEDGTVNRVERYVYKNQTLINKSTIIDNIPGAVYHDGGRISFGPDGHLYITTGDATKPRLSQDKDSLGGKILKLNYDGSIPKDNPFGNEVYSYGHRNPQGLTWDKQGRLWSTEHGRSGIRSGYDELNLIEKGENYGWPNIQGPEKIDGMRAPIVQSGADYTWAVASAQFYNNSIFFGGLRGNAIYEVNIEKPGRVIIHFEEVYGRIRTVRIFDEYLYFSTSNTDGRAIPKENDDKIYKILLKDIQSSP